MKRRSSFLSELFLHIKPVQILVALRRNNTENYASTLAKVADCTYSHTVKILDIFKREGLVQFEKRGRVKFITLTEKGEDIAKDFDRMLKKLAGRA